ncbi:MAG: YigZ family protein [Bacteroidaceae bacterium]|nr:YigZ family protein [Bacteroidaceae bacterium]
MAKRSEGTYSELRSKFLAFALPVRSAEEALALVAEFQKEYFDARHVCWAYRLGAEGEEYRSNDNGEPSGTAGKPILGQIVSADLSDVLVVVVRYFGGVKLGTSGLIVAYRTAAAEALACAEVVERTVDEQFTMGFSYEQMNTVMRVIKEYSPTIVSQEYEGNEVRMTLSLRQSLVAPFKEKFNINGRTVVRFDL